MGNCIPVSASIVENQTSLSLMELLDMGTDMGTDMGSFYNYTYEIFTDYDAVPCHNHYCAHFQRLAPPFLAVTCAAAALGTGALLLALAKRPHAWGWPQNRALVAQLAVGTGLFAALLPLVAVGIGQGWRLGTVPCKLTHLLWHWSLFAQGLLVGTSSFCTAWARWDSRSQRLAAALWGWALLLAVPAALSGGTVAASGTSCIQRSVEVLSPAYLLHLALCLCLFLLLPAALVVATVAVPKLKAGWEPGIGVSWLFLLLWAPYGVGLAVDFLLQARLLQPSCGTFQHFDFVLGLSQGLGVLHCCLVPAALVALRLCQPRAAAGGSG